MDMVFCGENRHRSRIQLIDAYNQIASGVGANMQSEPPCGRVVLIHGESGLGKTRLALELYRYLSSLSINADGYWRSNFDGLSDGLFCCGRMQADLAKFNS